MSICHGFHHEHIPMLMMKTMTNFNKTGLKTPKHTKIEHEQQEEVWNFMSDHQKLWMRNALIKNSCFIHNKKWKWNWKMGESSFISTMET